MGAGVVALVLVALLGVRACRVDEPRRPEPRTTRSERSEGATPFAPPAAAEEPPPAAEDARADHHAPEVNDVQPPERPRVSEEPPRQITVRVIEEDGTPVQGVFVQFARFAGNVERRGRTDALGELRLVAPPGAQTLEVFPDRGRGAVYLLPPEVPVAPHQVDAEVVLRRGVRTPVRVVTPEGAPVRGAFVLARESAGPHAGAPWADTATDADGRASLLLPPRRLLDVVVEYLDGARPAGEGALRSVRATPDGLVVTCRLVPQDRAVIVRVTDADGAPFPDARVHLFAETSRGGWRRDARTAPHGTARFEGLPAVELQVSVTEERGGLCLPRACRVVPEGQEVVLRFRRAAAIEGVVVVAPDRGVSGVQVEVRRALDDERLGAATTQEGGRFVLRVPVDEAGPFRLVVDGYDARKRGEYRGSLDGVRPGLGPVRVVADEN